MSASFCNLETSLIDLQYLRNILKNEFIEILKNEKQKVIHFIL